MSGEIIAPKIVEYSTLKQSIPSKRVSSVIVPSSGPNCAGGSMFVINIPPTAYFDASRSFLAFTLLVKKHNADSNHSWLVDPVRGFPFIHDGLIPGMYTAVQNTSRAAINPFGAYPLDAAFKLGKARIHYNHVSIPNSSDTNVFPTYCSKGGVLYSSHIHSLYPVNTVLSAAAIDAAAVGGDDLNHYQTRPFAKHWKALPPRPDRMHNGIHSLFKRIILRSQTGVPIEDIQEYNLLASIQRSCLQDAEFLNTTGKAEGYGDEHTLAYLFQRACEDNQDSKLRTNGQQTISVGGIDVVVTRAAGSNASVSTPLNDEPYGPKVNGVRFAMQPLMGILSTGQSLPLLFMGGVTFEFHLDDANVVFIRGQSTVAPVELYLHGYSTVDTAAAGAETNAHTLISSSAMQLMNYYATAEANVKAFTHKTNSVGSVYAANFAAFDSLTELRASICFPLPFISDENRFFSYELRSIEYHCDMVNFAPEFDDSIAQIISERGIQIDYTTFTNHHNNITLDGGSTTITIQDRATSLRGVFAVFRRANSIYGTEARGQAVLEDFYKDGIKSWQFRVGTRTVPNAPVNCEGLAIESFERFLMCFNKIPTSHLSVGDDMLPYIPTNVDLEDYSRQLLTSTSEESIRTKRNAYYIPLMKYAGADSLSSNLQFVGPYSLREFMNHYYSVEQDRFPFSDREIHPRHKFIIAQSFNEHKNTKSGINTAATALPIELILGIDSNVSRDVHTLYSTNNSYRYDVFVMSDRTLEIRCGGALTVVY